MVGDLSAVADGVALYEDGQWGEVGGTSIATPLVAAIFAAANEASADPSFPWKNTGDFFDVTSGSNGSCSTAYYLQRRSRLRRPTTGWGTPNGAKLGTTSPGDAGVTNAFSLALAPASATVDAGSSTTVAVDATLVSGSSQTVALSISGLPSGVTGTFAPTSIASNGGTSTLTLTASASATSGSTSFTVTGTGPSETQTATGTIDGSSRRAATSWKTAASNWAL